MKQTAIEVLCDVVREYDSKKGFGRRYAGLFPGKSARTDTFRELEALSRTGNHLSDDRLKQEIGTILKNTYDKKSYIRFENITLTLELCFKLDATLFEGKELEAYFMKALMRTSTEPANSLIYYAAASNIIQFFPDAFLVNLPGEQLNQHADNIYKNTPLLLCISNGDTESAIILAGLPQLDVTETDDFYYGQKTALHLLVAKGAGYQRGAADRLWDGSLLTDIPTMADIVKVLLARDDVASFIDTQDRYGNTALHIACLRKDNTLIQLLLDAGANSNITNNSGHTALDSYKRIIPRQRFADGYLNGIAKFSTKFGSQRDDIAQKIAAVEKTASEVDIATPPTRTNSL